MIKAPSPREDEYERRLLPLLAAQSHRADLG